jgi:carbamoylphosphate synthase small subunit
LEELLTYPKEKMRTVKDIFAGCSEESCKAKYKALSRKFHPDSAEGDKDAMINIDTQYKAYRERFKGSEKGGGDAQT